MNQFWRASQEKLNGKRIINVTCRQCNSGHRLLTAQSRINFIILAYNNSIKSNFSDILRGTNNCKNSNFHGHPMEVNHIKTPLCFWKIPTILWTNLQSGSNTRWEKLKGVALGSITLSPALLHMTLVLWMHSLYTHLAPQVRSCISLWDIILKLCVWVFNFYIVSGRSLCCKVHLDCTVFGRTRQRLFSEAGHPECCLWSRMGCLTASRTKNLPSQHYKNQNCSCTWKNNLVFNLSSHLHNLFTL